MFIRIPYVVVVTAVVFAVTPTTNDYDDYHYHYHYHYYYYQTSHQLIMSYFVDAVDDQYDTCFCRPCHFNQLLHSEFIIIICHVTQPQ